MVAGEPAEAVAVRLDLLAVVEDEGQVAVGFGDRGGDPQLNGDSGLHVGGAAAVQQVAVHPGGQVVGDRHGVQVSGEQHPLGAAEVGPGDDRVPVPVHGEVRQGPQGRLHGVGEHLLVAADGGDVDQSGGELTAGPGEVQHGHGLGIVAWRHEQPDYVAAETGGGHVVCATEPVCGTGPSEWIGCSEITRMEARWV